MKKLLTVLKDNSGATLVEALIAMALVTIAATMSSALFLTSQRITSTQYSLNAGQNNAFTASEKDLADGGTNPDGEEFKMKPEAGGNSGFSDLNGDGKVVAGMTVVNGGESGVQYKIFKSAATE